MNNQWKWIIILTALVLLLVGAYVLYEKLGDDYVPGGDIALPSESETESESKKPSAENGNETAGTTETEAETESDPHSVPAPAIVFYTYDGKPVSLSDLAGKPIILNFWASWCPPCKAEMPEFEEAYKTYGDRIHFVMLNANGGSDAKSVAHSFIAESGYTFPVYYDTDNTAYSAFAAYTSNYLPATFFVDENGNLVGYFVGQMSADVMAQGIELILN